MDTKRLTDLMRLRKISQRVLAEKIGFSQTAISQAINRNDFKVSILEKIAKVLGVPISYFFEDEQSLTQIENKEFDEFLNKYISENEVILTKLSDLLGFVLEKVECGFSKASTHKIEFEHLLLSSINVFAKGRKEFLFNDSSETSAIEILLKSFNDISTEQKKKYFIHILKKNKELAELNNKLFKEFLKMLNDRNNKYLEVYNPKTKNAYEKKYYGL